MLAALLVENARSETAPLPEDEVRPHPGGRASLRGRGGLARAQRPAAATLTPACRRTRPSFAPSGEMRPTSRTSPTSLTTSTVILKSSIIVSLEALQLLWQISRPGGRAWSVRATELAVFPREPA